MSLHNNTYQVDPLLVGRRVELIFDPSTSLPKERCWWRTSMSVIIGLAVRWYLRFALS